MTHKMWYNKLLFCTYFRLPFNGGLILREKGFFTNGKAV